MDDERKECECERRAQMIPDHNCLAWNRESWINQGKEAIYTKCMLCGKITGFHYKSFWKRLVALFNFNRLEPIRIKCEGKKGVVE